MVFHQLRLRLDAHGDEHAVHRQRPVAREAQKQARFGALDGRNGGGEQHLHMVIGAELFHLRAHRPQAVAAVDEGDVGKAGEIERVLHRRIAAADDGHALAAVEGAIAGGAVADAMADVFHFPGNAQFARRGAEGEDERAGLKFAAIQRQALVLHVDRAHLGVLRFHAEAGRLIGKGHHQFRAAHALGKAGIVFQTVGGGRLSARQAALDKHRLPAGARGVHACGQPRRAAADDRNVVHTLSSPCASGRVYSSRRP